MAEETNPQAPATPAGNQNLIIGLVLGAVVLLLFLLVLQVRTGGLGGDGGGESSEFAELKREVATARIRVNEERRLLGLPPLGVGSDGQSIEALAARINSDSSTLTSLAGQLQSLLTEKEQLLSSADGARRALTQQITELQRQVDQYRLAAGESATLQSKLTESRALLESANRQIDSLREQLNTAPSSNEMTNLNQRLESALADRDRFEKMVRDLNAQLVGKVDGAELDTLKRKVAVLEPENTKLRYEIQQLRAKLDRTRLFVEKVDDLPAAAKLLYTELAKLETATPAELQKEYGRIDEELQARVIDTISFPTGSSRINLDKVEEIQRASQSAGNESFFLVVGYASKTGSLDTNRTLSAERATTIASVTNFQKKEKQNVQAVFLGQTDRFSGSEFAKNQVCEIWELRKQ